MATLKARVARERAVMDEPTLARRRRVMRKTYLFLAPIWLFGLLSVGYAQWGWGVGEGNIPPRFPPPTFADRDFTFCKIMYTSVRREDLGMGWSTDYPYAGINLMIRFSELTKAPVSMDHRNDPNHWVVRFTDDELFHCPFTMASDVGTIGFTSEEVVRLREYLLKGGLLWVDDFWGTRAWDHWVREIGRVLPPSQYPIVDVPLDHPVFRTLAHVSEVPQITAIQFWRQVGGRTTSERGDDSRESHFRVIADAHGRFMVVMTHNTDVADAWEREGDDPNFFARFTPEGYGLGINVLLYAMSH